MTLILTRNEYILNRWPSSSRWNSFPKRWEQNFVFRGLPGAGEVPSKMTFLRENLPKKSCFFERWRFILRPEFLQAAAF
jgi:hypothetical protein